MPPVYPGPVRYQSEEKIAHLRRWAAGWSNGARGESLWSYSLRLGGSHALLNGWLKNPKLLAALTQDDRNMLREARHRSRQRAIRLESTDATSSASGLPSSSAPGKPASQPVCASLLDVPKLTRPLPTSTEASSGNEGRATRDPSLPMPEILLAETTLPFLPVGACSTIMNKAGVGQRPHEVTLAEPTAASRLV
jgi:hypothetical protein